MTPPIGAHVSPYFSVDAYTNLKSLQLVRTSSQDVSIADGSQTGLDLTGAELTLEAYLYPDSLVNNGGAYSVFNKYQASTAGPQESHRQYFTMLFQSAGVFKTNFWVGQGSGDTQNFDSVTWDLPDPVGSAQHFAWVYDVTGGAGANDRFFFYIDGVSQGNPDAILNFDGISGIVNGDEPFRIGSRAATRYFDGRVDHARVWSEVRSQAQIDANKQVRLVGSTANMEAEYLLDEDPTGATTADYSDNSNTLTLNGSPASGVALF